MDRIAGVIDSLDNIRAAMDLPMPADVHMGILRESIPMLREELRMAYIALGGEDYWAHP